MPNELTLILCARLVENLVGLVGTLSFFSANGTAKRFVNKLRFPPGLFMTISGTEVDGKEKVLLAGFGT